MFDSRKRMCRCVLSDNFLFAILTQTTMLNLSLFKDLIFVLVFVRKGTFMTQSLPADSLWVLRNLQLLIFFHVSCQVSHKIVSLCSSLKWTRVPSSTKITERNFQELSTLLYSYAWWNQHNIFNSPEIFTCSLFV